MQLDASGSASDTETFAEKDFEQMSAEELLTARSVIAELALMTAKLRTRRFIRSDAARGRLDLRRMLRSSGQHGGETVMPLYRKRLMRRPPLVVLCDISGSMDAYARLFLHFLYALLNARERVHCFLFGTRLTNITRELRDRDPDVALAKVSASVTDWSGGTRIGESLHAFNRQWSKRVLRRGAIVLIISDGWERGDVSTLRQEMRYLQHRCYRLIWLNPLLGQTTYQPLVEGMAAALPFIDDFLPIHNLQSLEALGEHLARLD
jgi:uncharacterized protein with von Willebrand factor type A (vWA) domain